MGIGNQIELALSLIGVRKRYRVRGVSMAPLLGESDIVVAKRVRSIEQLAVRDIVVATHPIERRTIIKTIHSIDREAGLLDIRGINPEHSTDSRSFGPIPFECVQGVVTAWVQ